MVSVFSESASKAVKTAYAFKLYGNENTVNNVCRHLNLAIYNIIRIVCMYCNLLLLTRLDFDNDGLLGSDDLAEVQLIKNRGKYNRSTDE